MVAAMSSTDSASSSIDKADHVRPVYRAHHCGDPPAGAVRAGRYPTLAAILQR
jgi:hypothetical protein